MRDGGEDMDLLTVSGQGKKGEKLSSPVFTPLGGRCLIQVVIPQWCSLPCMLGLEPLKEFGIATLTSSVEWNSLTLPSTISCTIRQYKVTATDMETSGKRK